MNANRETLDTGEENKHRYSLGVMTVGSLLGICTGVALMREKDYLTIGIISVILSSMLLLTSVLLLLTYHYFYRQYFVLLSHMQLGAQPQTPSHPKRESDPPPPYRKSWSRRYMETQVNLEKEVTEQKRRSEDLQKHLQGNCKFKGGSENKSSMEKEKKATDEGLPSYDMAMKVLDVRDLKIAIG